MEYQLKITIEIFIWTNLMNLHQRNKHLCKIFYDFFMISLTAIIQIGFRMR